MFDVWLEEEDSWVSWDLDGELLYTYDSTAPKVIFHERKEHESRAAKAISASGADSTSGSEQR